MHLTRDGIRVLVASVGILTVGIWLGWPLAELLAGAGLGAVGFASLSAGRGPQVRVARDVYPARVVRGEPAVARLQVRNGSGRRSAAFEAHDAAGDRRVAVSVPRLAAGGTAHRTYRLPTDRRGRHDVGPLTLTRQDALGLVRTDVTAGETAVLWVHPCSHPMRVPDVGASRRFDGPTTDPRVRGSLVFHALREYAVGDDLRHVHWKSTARAGRLMVREHTDPDEPQATVVLDTCRARWTDASFEDAVEVAASVALAFTSAGLRVRVVTGSGADIGTSTGQSQTLLDALSEVGCDDLRRRPLRDLLRRDADAGVLVLITAGAGTADLGDVTRVQQRLALSVVFDLGSGSTPLPASGPTVIAEPTASAAIAAWNAGNR